MAVSADGFGISCAFWFGGMICFALTFQYLRRLKWTEKYYQKNFYFPPDGLSPPPYIKKNDYWPKAVISLTEKTVLESCGTDALMYIKTLRFAFEVFVLVTFFTCAIILPINITGTNVDSLSSSPYDNTTVSEYIAWYLPGLNGTAINGTDESEAVTVIKAPNIYNDSIGPAPPGLKWWERLPDVPPLPTPEEALGPAYANYTWIYDDKYQVVQYDLTALDKTTMTNIAKESDYLYAHAVVTWLVTILVMWRMGVYAKQALNLRMLFFMENSGIQGQSVLVRDIPLKSVQVKEKDVNDGDNTSDEEDDIPDTTSWFERKFGRTLTRRRVDRNVSGEGDARIHSKKGDLAIILPDRWEEAAVKSNGGERNHAWLVEHEFETLYGSHEVVESYAVYNTAKLAAVVAAYDKTKEAAFSAVDQVVSSYADEKKREKMKKPLSKLVVGKTMGKWGTERYGLKPKKVDAFEFYCDRLAHLREEIAKEQKAAKAKPLPSAFVQFKSRRTQVIASQTMMCEDLGTWVTSPAPGPDELYWGNLRIRKRERDIRATTYTVAFWVLMAFYMIPVAAVQVLLSSNSLVGFLQTIPIAAAILTGIIPGLALRIFVILLPMILTAMLLKIRGTICKSELDGKLQSGMFIFEFITVFLGSFIAGTFANQFQQVLDDPGSIIQIFGTAAPQVGIFFWTYILTQACWEIPMSILDAVGLIIYHLKLKLASTARSKQKVHETSVAFGYGAMVPDDGIVFLLGIVFSVASPLIAPCALIYFGVRYLVNKHNLTYKLAPEYDAGGSFFLTAFNQYVTALIAFQLVTIFILAIKESIGPPIIVAPLPIITLVWYISARSDLRKPFADQSIMMAHDADLKAKEPPTKTSSNYLDPVFVFDDTDHNTAIQQCTVLKNAQAQDTWPNDTIATLIDEDADDVASGETTFHDIEDQS